MIDFSGKTYQNILNEQLEQIPDTIDKREGSFIQTALGPEAWYLEGFYQDLNSVQINAYAGTAVGESLDLICAQRGITRKTATSAIKVGTFNVQIPIGSRFSSTGENALVYVATAEIGGSAGAYTYQMTCQTPGQAGNNYSGQLLAIDYVTGLITASLGDIITSGTDEETDDALRARFFATFDVPSFGGNIASYRNEILAIEGVGAVQVYPAWNGGGTVLCSILNSNLLPADPPLVSRVQEVICPPEDGGETPSPNGYGLAPIGAAVTITSGTEVTLNISCTIEFASTVQNGAETYQSDIENAINQYLSEVNATWGNALKSQKIEYSVVVYISRIIFAILTISDIINVTDVTINDVAQDFTCTETSALQQVPVLGTVTINGG